MPNNTNPLTSQDPGLKALHQQLLGQKMGVDTTVARQTHGALREREYNRAEESTDVTNDGFPTDDTRFRAAGVHAAAVEALYEDNNEDIADRTHMSGFGPVAQKFPELSYELTNSVREGWRGAREEFATGVVQEAQDGTSFWKTAVAKFVGADATQIGLGGLEVFTRAQQVLYGLARGEGGAAFGRLFPSVVLENQYNEDGTPKEESPMAAAIDAAWAKLRGDEEEYQKELAELRQVNAKYMEMDMLEASDVFETWVGGKDNLDKIYEDLADNGFWGKVGMASLSLGYAAAEVFADPLFIFEKLPSASVNLVRAGMSPARKAVWSSRKAALTRRYPDRTKALDDAQKLLDFAMEEHQSKPTVETAARLKNALKLVADRQDDVLVMARKPGDVDMVNLTATPHRDPATLPFDVEGMTQDEIAQLTAVYEGRTAYKSKQHVTLKGLNPADHSPHKVVLQQRRDRGLPTTDGRRQKQPLFGPMDFTDAPQSPISSFIVAMGEAMGLPITFFKQRATFQHLLGWHDPRAARVYINSTMKPEEQLTTFFHELWHFVFHNTFNEKQRLVLLKRLEDAGVDLGRYQGDLPGNYAILDKAGVADEMTARTVSEISADQKFWDTLADVAPEEFKLLANDSVNLALDALNHIDVIGGRAPSEWFKPGSAISDFTEHTVDVMRAIELAMLKRPKIREEALADFVGKLTRQIDEFTINRERLHAAGHAKTPQLDKHIDKLRKLRKELETDGFTKVIKTMHMAAESYRVMNAVEIRNNLIRMRLASLAKQENMAQTNMSPIKTEKYKNGEEPTTAIQHDLFEGDMTRVALGPDHTEQNVSGVLRLMDGATEDDVSFLLNALPENQASTGSRIVPATRDNMIDFDALEETLATHRRKAEAFDMELWEYDPEAAVLEAAVDGDLDEDMLATMVNAGEAAGDGIVEGPSGPKTLKEWRKQNRKRKLTRKRKQVEKMDTSWLPQENRSTTDIIQESFFPAYQATFFDRVAKGLDPDSWMIKAPAWLRATAMFMREPMRVFEAVDPGGSWPILRGAMFNAESETTRLKGVFHSELERFGAIEVKEPTTLRKVFLTGAEQKENVNEELNELLFNILDEEPGTDEYALLMSGLSQQQITAVQNIRHELDLIASRLGIVNTRKFVKGYITHAFDRAWYAKGGMMPENYGMGRRGKIFLSQLMDRQGGEDYARDAVGALDLYSRGVSRKLHLEPAMERVGKRVRKIVSKDQRNRWLLKYTDMTIAQLRGEPSMLGSVIDSAVGAIAASTGRVYTPGTVSRKMMGLSSLIYSSLLTGNRRYPIMSIATALATTGAQYGMFRTVKGLFMMARPEGQLVFNAVGGNQLWSRIFEGDLMVNFTKNMSQLRLAGPSIQDTENFIRGMTFWAAIDDMLAKSGFRNIQAADEAGLLQEILFDALRTTEEVNHFFGIGSRAPILSRVSKSGSVALTQFQSFPYKQTEQLLAMARDNPGKIFSYMMLSGWISRVGAQELGMDLSEYVGLEYLPQGLGDVQSPGIQLMLSSMRMMGSMSAIIEGRGDVEQARKHVDEFLKDGEVVVPFMRIAREAGRAAEVQSTGQVSTPGLGYPRDVDVVLGPFGLAIPTGEKGRRSEALSMYTGARSVEETRNIEARGSIGRVKNQASIERLMLIEKAHDMMMEGDFTGMQEQLQRMAAMGMPVGDISSSLKARAETKRLYWYMLEIKKNKNLAHHIVPILDEHGILRQSGGGGAQEQAVPQRNEMMGVPPGTFNLNRNPFLAIPKEGESEDTYVPGPPGSVSWRELDPKSYSVSITAGRGVHNNNPGNLRESSSKLRSGYEVITRPDGTKDIMAKFPTPEIGFKALVRDIQLKQARGMSLAEFINIYAPAEDKNDPESYTAYLTQKLKVGSAIPLHAINAVELAKHMAMLESRTTVRGI